MNSNVGYLCSANGGGQGWSGADHYSEHSDHLCTMNDQYNSSFL